MLDDEGIYECSAMNLFGHIEATGQLAVRRKCSYNNKTVLLIDTGHQTGVSDWPQVIPGHWLPQGYLGNRIT